MEKTLDTRLHVLSLVIKRPADIPTVRAKAKRLAQLSSGRRRVVIQIAAAASELARLVLQTSEGGKVDMSWLRFAGPEPSTGIELHFEGKRPCASLTAREGRGTFCPTSAEALEAMPPIAGLKGILDEVRIEGGFKGSALRITCYKSGLEASWKELQQREAEIRRDLFADIEESYLENLRVKHEEVLGLLREVSAKNVELDQANAELLQMTQDLEALAHERTVVEVALRIADEVRNPATVIGGLAKIVMRKLPQGAEPAEKLDAIYKQAQKLERIVRNFESLAETQSTFFVTGDLRALVEEALKASDLLFTKRHLRLAVDMPPEPVSAKMNPRTLKVALLHILKNAAQASPPGGKLQVSLTRTKGHPVLSVRDHGPGIPPGVQKKLLKASVTTKASGTGVGLLLVQQILREHQGTIEIAAAPGGGTKVSLKFPIRWKEGEASEPIAEEAPKEKEEKKPPSARRPRRS